MYYFKKERDYIDRSKKINNPRVCLKRIEWHVQGVEH